MKILIITMYFPPQNSIASLRPYSWAKHWSKAGHDVTVVTTPKESMAFNNQMSFDGFRVIEIPIPGLWLIRKIWGHNPQTAIIQNTANNKSSASYKKHLRELVKKLRLRYGIFSTCRMPDLLDFWSGDVQRAVNNQQWDLVVSSAGPYCVHAPAYGLQHKGIAQKWIADWRDLWVDNHIYPGLPVFRWVEQKLEKQWCITADCLTTVSHPLADTLKAKYGDKVHVIYNGYDPDDYKALPNQRIFPNDNIIRIVYTGTIYQGQQNPTPLFNAIRVLKDCHKISELQLKIIFCGNNADVTNLACKSGVEEFVEYVGVINRNEALRMQRDASALLLLEFESQTVKGILTGKLFEYLSVDAPILAIGIGSDTSIGTVLSETGRGVALGNNVELITDFLLKLLNKKEPVLHSLPNKKHIQKYNRKVQANNMLELLKSNICY